MKKIQFAIHDLNPYGGQDRSTLEILLRLTKRLPIRIHAYTLSTNEMNSVFNKVVPNLGRPVFLKIIYFYFVLLLREIRHSVLDSKEKWIWHTTGTSHFRSHFLHLQFIHASWRDHRGKSSERGLRWLYKEILERFNILMERICFQEGKVYLAISQSVANDLQKFYSIKNNVYVVHHGVDPIKFFPLEYNDKKKMRQKVGVPEEAQIAILVGSYERKGLEASIKALAEIKDQLENFQLVAVGDGDSNFFIQLAESLGVKNKIILFPKQKNIIDFYQSADLFLLPTQYEPFGLVITEALACGLPAIVSKCAGGSELLTNRVHGFLIQDPFDHKEISQYLLEIIQSPGKLVDMSIAARALAERRSWDQVANEFESVFNAHLDDFQ